MVKFDEFVSLVKAGVKPLATRLLDGYDNEALADCNAFLTRTDADLKKWSQLLANGSLTEDDFVDLLEAKKALAEIRMLREAGVALVKLEQFREGLIRLVADSALRVFL